jgi:hypothetical protein
MTFTASLLLPEAACFVSDRFISRDVGGYLIPSYRCLKFERFNDQTYFIRGGHYLASITAFNRLRDEFKEDPIDLSRLLGMKKNLKDEIRPFLERGVGHTLRVGVPLSTCNLNCVLIGFYSSGRPFLANFFMGRNMTGELGNLELTFHEEPGMNVIVSPWLKEKTNEEITRKIHAFLDRFFNSPVSDQREGFKHLAKELITIASRETLFVSPHADHVFIGRDRSEEKFFRLGPASYFRTFYLLMRNSLSRRWQNDKKHRPCQCSP